MTARQRRCWELGCVPRVPRRQVAVVNHVVGLKLRARASKRDWSQPTFVGRTCQSVWDYRVRVGTAGEEGVRRGPFADSWGLSQGPGKHRKCSQKSGVSRSSELPLQGRLKLQEQLNTPGSSLLAGNVLPDCLHLRSGACLQFRFREKEPSAGRAHTGVAELSFVRGAGRCHLLSQDAVW